MPDFMMSLCRDDDDGSCVRQCKLMFPVYCAHPNSQTFALCVSDGSKVAEQRIFLYILCLIAVITV